VYEYLVQVTGHDYERANRLIEEERKHAPDANRKEWIKRPIERFWRDNR
jgi:hypothetical protein